MNERDLYTEAEAQSQKEKIPKTVIFLDILLMGVLCVGSIALLIIVFAGDAAPIEALWGFCMIGVLGLHFWDNCWLNAAKWRSKRRNEIFDKLMRENNAAGSQ